jgi:hypothetical protein
MQSSGTCWETDACEIQKVDKDFPNVRRLQLSQSKAGVMVYTEKAQQAWA